MIAATDLKAGCFWQDGKLIKVMEVKATTNQVKVTRLCV